MLDLQITEVKGFTLFLSRAQKGIKLWYQEIRLD
jgi:hypothetical protein